MVPTESLLEPLSEVIIGGYVTPLSDHNEKCRVPLLEELGAQLNLPDNLDCHHSIKTNTATCLQTCQGLTWRACHQQCGHSGSCNTGKREREAERNGDSHCSVLKIHHHIEVCLADLHNAGEKS
ncbi:hypothetical protein GN956_G3217 [Arapaima gigas]